MKPGTLVKLTDFTARINAIFHDINTIDSRGLVVEVGEVYVTIQWLDSGDQTRRHRLEIEEVT